MSQRGRGLLEIQHSNNPFFQTSGRDVGVNPYSKKVWSGDVDPAMIKKNVHAQENFSFLYTRESDTIGSRVTKPSLENREILTKTEFLKKRREELRSNMGEEDLAFDTTESSKFQITAEEILSVYKHEPKNEDPRFTTSSNDYGKKIPSVATLVTDRAARQQTFSKSFNNVKPKNSSLNTAISRSTVHPKLDPQFL